MKGGRLHIVNESRYPTAEVESLVRFALQEIDVRGDKLVAVVKNTKRSKRREVAPAYSGTAYSLDGGIPSSLYDKYVGRRKWARFLIVMRIGPPEAFPTDNHRRYAGVDKTEFRDWQEALVAITAHEGMHAQHTHDGSYRERTTVERFHPAFGHKIRMKRRIGSQRIEPKCEAFEASMVRRFREIASGDGLPTAGHPATVRLANVDGEEAGERATEVA